MRADLPTRGRFEGRIAKVRVGSTVARGGMDSQQG
jgi:hypothetical protein